MFLRIITYFLRESSLIFPKENGMIRNYNSFTGTNKRIQICYNLNTRFNMIFSHVYEFSNKIKLTFALIRKVTQLKK